MENENDENGFNAALLEETETDPLFDVNEYNRLDFASNMSNGADEGFEEEEAEADEEGALDLDYTGDADYEFITNQKGREKLYAHGFGFWRKLSRGIKTYWRCEFCDRGCPSTATTIKLADGSHRVYKVDNIHNHLVSLDRKQKFIGRHSMKLDSLTNAEALPIVISEKAIKDNENLGSYFGSSQQLREVVTYTRRVKLNKYPYVDPENKFFKIDERFCTIKDKSSILYDWKDEENNQRILVIGTRELFEQLCNSFMWQFDCTFRSCPKPFTQLATIFGNNVAGDSYTCYAMVYVMLTGKTMPVYQQLFKCVADLARQFCFNIQLQVFLSDFELAIGTAVISQFPHVLTYFCFFHFNQSIIKRVKELGLWTEYHKPDNKKWVDLILALPMLPPSLIVPVFEDICRNIPEVLEPLFGWFSVNYLVGRYDVAKWSVNLLLIRGFPKSQSFAESSHKKLNSILRVKRPQFYKVTAQLSTQLVETKLQIESHKLLGHTPKKRKLSFVENDKRIVALLGSCSSSNALETLKLISKLLRDDSRSHKKATQKTQNLNQLNQVANNSLPLLPTLSTLTPVQHPVTVEGTLPQRARRSEEATRKQETIGNDFFNQYRSFIDQQDPDAEAEKENYPLMDIESNNGSQENYEEFFLFDDDMLDNEDSGYVSGEGSKMHADDNGPGRSAGYQCSSCSRNFNTKRGLGIHKAKHNRDNKSSQS